MGSIEVRLPDDVAEAIAREIAAGRASSAEDYVLKAHRDYLSAEDELAAEARAGITDIEVGRFDLIDDLDAWGANNLARVRRHLADDPSHG